MTRTAWEYGKLGLLIDDQPDAAARVARELYGADALPAWWQVARSMECAYQALTAFREILQQTDLQGLRGLVVVDRYLPGVCGRGPRRPIPWDYPPVDPEEDSVWRERLQELVGRLLDTTSSASNFHMKFITSYPFAQVRHGEIEPASAGLRVSWKVRSIELLHQYRQEILRDPARRRLLRYGPEPDAPIVFRQPAAKVLKQDKVEAARWKARVWRKSLESLVRLLKSGRGPVVLLTGAGASLAQGAYGAGMAETWQLLQRACRQVKNQDGEARAPGERWPPRPVIPCACAERPRTGSARPPRWSARNQEEPLAWLLRQSDAVRDLDWRLEDLFDPKKHHPADDKFRRFHRSFRDALYRCDHEYAYHHWLIARMPWTAILTTNFDGFHERAAAAVAQLPWLDDEARSRCLRLGTPVHEWRPGDNPPATLLELAGQFLEPSRQVEVRKLAAELRRNDRREEGPALFKPYGSLYSPAGDIALTLDEMGGFKGRFQEALEGALETGDEGALIVVGHSMRDDFIDEILRGLESRFDGLQLLWIDPKAYERCSGGSGLRTWERMLRDRKGRCETALTQEHERRRRHRSPADYSGPLPSTALEFLYDLWLTYQEK